MEEVWKDVVGYEGYYQISNYGYVKNILTGKIKIPVKRKDGYYNIKLTVKQKYKMFLLHRLLAQHFIDNINNYPEVNHIDGIKINGKLENLEWVDRSMNMKHRYKIGLCNHIGSNNNCAKINEVIARNIKNLFYEGLTIKEILYIYPKISRDIINNIKFGKAWNHV